MLYPIDILNGNFIKWKLVKFIEYSGIKYAQSVIKKTQKVNKFNSKSSWHKYDIFGTVFNMRNIMCFIINDRDGSDN